MKYIRSKSDTKSDRNIKHQQKNTFIMRKQLNGPDLKLFKKLTSCPCRIWKKKKIGQAYA